MPEPAHPDVGVLPATHQLGLLHAAEHTADGLMLTNRGGEVVYANHAAKRLLEGDLVGQKLAQLAGGYLGSGDTKTGPPSSSELWSTFEFGGSLIELHHRQIDQSGVLFTLTTLKDVTSRIQTERSLRARIAFEDLTVSIAASFITLSADQVDGAIDSALARVGRAAAVDRAYVYLLNGPSMTLANVWAGPDNTSE